MKANQKVAILGASDNPDRYSYKAMKQLEENDHEVFLVTPRLDEVDGKKTYKSLKGLSNIDTLTMYVSPKLSSDLLDEIISLNPGRIIFNPGSENIQIEESLNKANIPFEYACTLVLLTTGQF